jgi:hypothetical protein
VTSHHAVLHAELRSYDLWPSWLLLEPHLELLLLLLLLLLMLRLLSLLHLLSLLLQFHLPLLHLLGHSLLGL